MTFKSWNSNGTAAMYHRTTVLNAVAESMGAEASRRAAQWIGSAERVTGIIADQAAEYASACVSK